jgi:hypothetical protein
MTVEKPRLLPVRIADQRGRAIVVDLEYPETLWGEGNPTQSFRHEAQFNPCMRAT